MALSHRKRVLTALRHHDTSDLGYILAAVHNIQPGVPVENIIAMYEAGREYGSYPIVLD